MLVTQPDWYGISAVIAAITGLLTATFAFILSVKQGKTATTAQAIHDEIQTGNGRTIGEAASAVADAVTPLDKTGEGHA